MRFPSPFAVHPYTFGLLGCALLVIGCSSGSHPATTPHPEGPARLPLVAEDAGSRIAPLFAGHVTFDTATMQATLTPARTAASGSQDVLEYVDITQFFTNAPCNDCLKIAGIGTAPSGNPTLDISIRHPFPSPGPGLNPRDDLAVFNVECLTIFGESNQTLTSYSGIGAQAVTSSRLVNADGYSGALDAAYDADYIPTTATVHPYRLFFDDYSNGSYDAAHAQGFPVLNDIFGHLAMGQGKGPDVKTFEFATKSPGATLQFELVVQAAFGNSSANLSERLTPEYRLPQYNKKAASEVHVGVFDATTANTSGRGLLGGVSSSAAQVVIQVLDPSDASTGVTIGTNRDQLRAASDVAQLTIDIPGVLTSPLVINDPSTILVGGTGDDPADPLTYSTTITNSAAAVDGTYFGLVKVTDSYPVGGNQILPEDAQRYGSPGFTVPFALTEIATYALFPVPVHQNVINRLVGLDIGDALGTSLAIADFNGDGVLDLAAGAFERDVSAVVNAGAVHVYYAFPNGDFATPLILSENTPATNARLGFFLAAGDVTGDGRADLLASAVDQNIPGRVNLFRSQGLGFLPGLVVQDLTLPNTSRFGWSMVVQDVNSDGFADAFIAAPEALGSFIREGRVYRFMGSAGGIGSPTTTNAPDPAADALFGSSMVLIADSAGIPTHLAVGMPGHDLNTGRVYAFPFSGSTLGSPQVLDPTAPVQDANFGYALAAGDLTQNGRMDLAIGAPGAPSMTTGQVEVRFLAGNGLFGAGPILNFSGVDTYTFGSAIAIGDFDGNGQGDVAAGGLLLDVGPATQAGRCAIFPAGLPTTAGSALEFEAPSATLNQLFSRSVLTLPQPGGADLLLVGALADDPSGLMNAGSVYLY